MAIWLDAPGRRWARTPALVADTRRARRRRGRFEPKTIYREDSDSAPPVLDELVLIVGPGRDAAALRRPPSAAGSSARARTSPAGCRTGPRTTSAAGPRGRGASIAAANGLCDRRPRREAGRRARHGHVPRGGPGQREQAADDRHALGRRGREGRARPAPRDGRQGRLLRLRRHQHQAGRPDGRDEDGQDRCVHRDRGHRDRRPARARACRCSRSRRRSRTCPAAARPGPATSSGR